jgi:multiple sugar transport system substrate-binding protein
MKRILCLALSLVMVLSCFTACSGSGSKSASSGGSEWPSVTIHYLNINSASMGGPAIQKLTEKFNSTNDKNIKVEFNFISANYQEIASAVQSYLAAGNDVGVVQVGYSYINYYAENFPQMQDLNKVISTYSPSDKGILDKYYTKTILSMGKSLNGKQTGLPYGMSTPLLYYNADMAKKAGLDPDNPPKTWEQVRTWAEAIKKSTGYYGVGIQNPGDTYSIIPLFLSAGSEVLTSKNGKYSASFYNKNSVAAWTFIQKMKTDGIYAQLTLDDGVASFAGGKLGMFLTTSGRVNYFKQACKFDVRSAMQPAFEGKTLKVCTGGNVLAIVGKKKETIKASWEFMKYLIQPSSVGAECAATGYLPPTSNSSDDPTLKTFLASNSMINAAVEEMKYSSQWTSWPGKNGLSIDQYLINMRDAILSNNANVDSTIKSTQSTINSMLS